MLSAIKQPSVLRPNLPPRPANMTGPAGLLAAVIHQALLDYHKGDLTAVKYFEGQTYKQHLQLLGLPDNWLPETIKT